MSFLTLILTAIGLSMDAFAVSVTGGIITTRLKIRHALKIGFFFGFFQAFMPLLGWLAGVQFRRYIVSFDHWVAFTVLALIGLKMIWEAVQGQNAHTVFNPLDNKVLLLLAVATSIDALAVGVSFSFLQVSLLYSVTVIGLITFLVCSLGVWIGKMGGWVLKQKAEIAGGLILILIGAKILLEHLLS